MNQKKKRKYPFRKEKVWDWCLNISHVHFSSQHSLSRSFFRTFVILSFRNPANNVTFVQFSFKVHFGFCSHTLKSAQSAPQVEWKQGELFLFVFLRFQQSHLWDVIRAVFQMLSCVSSWVELHLSLSVSGWQPWGQTLVRDLCCGEEPQTLNTWLMVTNKQVWEKKAVRGVLFIFSDSLWLWHGAGKSCWEKVAPLSA